MLFLIFYFASIFASNSCELTYQDAKDSLFLNNNLKLSKKLIYKAYDLCKKNGDLSDKNYEIFDFMSEYLEIGLDDIYKLCKSGTKINCAYYKAKMYESLGNISIAKNIYRKNAFYKNFVEILVGQNINPQKYMEFKYLRKSEQKYYLALYYFGMGFWNKVLTLLKINNLKELKLVFLSELMLGNFEKAEKQLSLYNDIKRRSETNFVKNLLKAISLYAKNRQEKAKKILKDFLLYKPHDKLALKYLAQIYYRTGCLQKAEKIYLDLLKYEWRPTERFYLLKERIEMLIRYKRFVLAKQILDKTLVEYKEREDLIQDTAIIFANMLNFKDAFYYAKLLKNKFTYNDTLASIFSIQKQNKKALEFAKRNLFQSSSYSKKRVQVLARNLISKGKFSYNCSKYKIKKISKYKYKIRRQFDSMSTYYYLNTKNRSIIVPICYQYSKFINAKKTIYYWKKNIENYWSLGGYTVRIKNTKSLKANLIHVKPWPSSFYRKRPSIDEWILLMPDRIAVHEFGHLLGLDDEYFEQNKKIKTDRKYIGSRDSIMRNAISGLPLIRHINLISNIYRYCNVL